MTITSNQIDWANIYLKHDKDHAEIMDGVNPFNILERINAEISGLCVNLDTTADAGCLERISVLLERGKDILNYLKETTVPV